VLVRKGRLSWLRGPPNDWWTVTLQGEPVGSFRRTGAILRSVSPPIPHIGNSWRTKRGHMNAILVWPAPLARV
jgi:hypothetical protein